MSEITTNWTKEEFKAYLLLYAAHADFIESEEEQELIRELVPVSSYKAIHKELEHDNDYQSIQKILHNVEKFNYSRDDLNQLMKDINTVFNADGAIDLQEENMLLALKRLLK